jgi:hypothetical protein
MMFYNRITSMRMLRLREEVVGRAVAKALSRLLPLVTALIFLLFFISNLNYSDSIS